MQRGDTMITIKQFGEYKLYIIENGGCSVALSDLGATVQSLCVPDRKGNLGDVVLGYDTPEEYLNSDGFLGAFVGRYANRISGARFSLDGREYALCANDGKNTLHGGGRLSYCRFAAEASQNSVTFTLRDPDGSCGFPGNADISVRYTFTDDRKLYIDYAAVSDADTVFCLTNHSYFNLHCSGNVLAHELMINADTYLPTDAELIPTGERRSVCKTEFDFRTLRPVTHGGFDHCYILNGESCAVLYDPSSGRRMTVTTDMPGVQLYCAGMLSERRGKHGSVMGKNSGLCLETEFFPDTPNHPEFPSCTVRAGERFTSRTVYAFDAI